MSEPGGAEFHLSAWELVLLGFRKKTKSSYFGSSYIHDLSRFEYQFVCFSSWCSLQLPCLCSHWLLVNPLHQVQRLAITWSALLKPQAPLSALRCVVACPSLM